jgi:hypothetical protein
MELENKERVRPLFLLNLFSLNDFAHHERRESKIQDPVPLIDTIDPARDRGTCSLLMWLDTRTRGND